MNKYKDLLDVKDLADLGLPKNVAERLHFVLPYVRSGIKRYFRRQDIEAFMADAAEQRLDLRALLEKSTPTGQ